MNQVSVIEEEAPSSRPARGAGGVVHSGGPFGIAPATPAGAPAGVPVARVPAYASLARWFLAAFLLTVLLSRLIVLLIMVDVFHPRLYLRVGGAHIHHMYYGAALLAATTLYALLRRPRGWRRVGVVLVYGMALGLVCDEYSIWMKLPGPYFHEASFMAVGLVAGLCAALSVGPRLRRGRRRGASVELAVLGALALLAFLMVRWLPYLQEIEAHCRWE